MARIKKHPGLLLRAELEERVISANHLALAPRVPAQRGAGDVGLLSKFSYLRSSSCLPSFFRDK